MDKARISYRKLETGNWRGRYGAYHIFIYRRPHGKWCARMNIGGTWYQEGYFGTSLPTLKKAKNWINSKLNPPSK